MSKTAITGCFSFPLDGILGTRAKVGVLRVLAGAPVPLGLREVARRSGMAFRSIELAIKELVALGVLDRIDGSRERLVKISPTHRLAGAVLALLRAEGDFRPALSSELRVLADAGCRDGLLAVAIIGAAASGQERVGDSLELLFIAQDARTLDRWRKAFEKAQVDLARRYGLSVALVGYDIAQARKLWQTRTAAAERSIIGADLISGADIRAILEV